LLLKHRVCDRLNKTFTEIDVMPYPEYRSWVAYILKEPTDGLTQARYSADLYALMLNINRDQEKNPEPIKSDAIYPWCSDKLPDYLKTDEERKADEDIQNAEALKTLLNLSKL
jgi:hypothetical protein